MTDYSEEERTAFWSRTHPEPNSGCWLWDHKQRPAKVDYGSYCLRGQSDRAHRIAWMLYRGTIPKGMVICHKCDTPACVNPDHLFLGTYLENRRDQIKKGRNNPSKGQTHLRATLKDEDVMELRRMSRTGLSFSAIARLTDMKVGQVWKICTGFQWKHLPMPMQDKGE